MSNIISTFPKFSFCIEVSADFALFTNKKDERITYNIPTSGAVRGLIESIFWKPAIRYIPRRIEVINPVETVSVKKNELKMGCKNDLSQIILDGSKESMEKYCIQRNNIYLSNVRYRIHADLVFIPKEYRETEYHEDENPKKYYEMLKRRVINGQHRYGPYLGTRECVCNEIEWIDENSPAANTIKQDEDFGIMYVDYLYHEDYTEDERKQMKDFFEKEQSKKFSVKKGKIRPRAVSGHVEMKNGIVTYPDKYELKVKMLDDMEKYWCGK